MIQVTRLNGLTFHLDAEKVESVESTPDTVITLVGGKTVMVRESVDEVVQRIIRYRRRIHAPRACPRSRKSPVPP
jgi:flagellar protein FlbD